MYSAPKPTYIRLAEAVPGIVDSIQKSKGVPRLFQAPITDLTDIVCKGDRELKSLTILDGSHIDGKFLHLENIGGIEQTLPYKLVNSDESYRAGAEANLYHQLVHAHQWARGENFDFDSNPDSEAHSKSKQGREAIREQVFYLFTNFDFEIACESLKRVEDRKPWVANIVSDLLLKTMYRDGIGFD